MGFALSDMQLQSTAFAAHGMIPRRHTGEGEDVAPALSWTRLPKGTQSLALVVHDPDAPLISGNSYGFVHWVLYNIPANVAALPGGMQGYTSGVNDFGHARYNGPMPPPGHGMHHYYFLLFALDEDLRLAAGLTMWQLLEKIGPHVIGMNRLVGTYERRAAS